MREIIRPKRRAPRIVLGIALLGGVSVVGLYALRKPIAEHFVDAQLNRFGVRGSYKLTQLGPYHQRLENVVIGDPAEPDLTADWVELSTKLGIGTAAVDEVRAGGVRLRGSLDDGGALHFGALDKFRSTEPGPFKMPDIGLDLADARLALGTRYGEVNARIDGKGNLAHDFEGKLAVQTVAISSGGCSLAPGDAQLALHIRSGKPQMVGPIRAAQAGCGPTQLTNPVVTLDAIFSDDLKGARGTLSLASDKISSPALLRGARSLDTARNTPLAPFGAQFSKAILALGAGMTINTRFEHDPARGSVLSGITLTSTSGARVALKEGAALRISPAGKLRFDGAAVLKGGGFPDAELIGSGSLRTLSAKLSLAPLVAPGTRLALAPITLNHDARGTSIDTSVVFDGAIAGGAVRGLRLPITGIMRANSGFALTNPCIPIALESMNLSELSLGKTDVTMCMTGADIRISAPRLAGRYAGEQLALGAESLVYNQPGKALRLSQVSAQLGTALVSAAEARYSLVTKQFSVLGLMAQAGTPGHVSALTAESMDGALSGTTATGHYGKAQGRLPNVPLALSNSSGSWRFARGALVLTGNLDVADSNPAKRFEPLTSRDVALRYANGVITASGTLHEPKSGAFVAKVDINHAMKAGAGEAIIAIKDMPLLSFGKALQPEALTRITLGVVANLKGAIGGEGHIHWSEKGVTSDGRFATDHMDLAAAFGPVSGIKGEIVFTDLLGMVSAPNQVVTIENVNPGVDVQNGTVHYRLLPGNKVEIEGGNFPFAGGSLILAPTVLDMSEAAERRLTFRVEGVDAGKFLNAYQFEDVSATGIFDGELPLIFTAAGGRIESGRLAVREAGGTVSYVGPVSNATLGKFGKLAFDALKSIKYRGLTVDLSGPLDGEMVTVVKLNGTNQGALSSQKSYFLKQIVGIPFKFNIRITAPFRSLMTSAHNLQDPSNMVQQSLPKNLKVAPPPLKPSPNAPVNPPANSVQK